MPLAIKRTSVALFMILAAISVAVLAKPSAAEAHQSGCHRWHSCPSDSGSYACGDLGYSCQYGTTPSPVYTPPVYTPPFVDKDCEDFSSQQAAQSYFNANPGDPSALDADKDGKACEGLPATAGSDYPPECDDELDNDLDGTIDLKDPDCENSSWNNEGASACTLAQRSSNRARRAVRRAKRMVKRSHGSRRARYRRVLRKRKKRLTTAQLRAKSICFPPKPDTSQQGATSTSPAAIAPAAPITPTPPQVQAPTASSQSLTTTEDTPLSVVLTGTAVPGRSMNFVITGTTAYGLLGGTAPNVFYTPDSNYFGSDSFPFKVNDGSTDSALATVGITVEPVNDAPSFELPASPDQTVPVDAGAQSVPAFAANISSGPSNEGSQTLTFSVTNDNNALFDVLPSIDPSGALLYTPAPGQTGTATVNVVLEDDGGASNGGSDMSTEKGFAITVQPPAGL